MAVLTNTQEIILATIGMASSITSISCSSCILYFVTQQNERNTYLRVLFGMSIMDIINSATFAIQPYLSPKSDDRFLAHGNEATCTMLGFFAQLGIGGILYNGMLSANFMLSICYGFKQTFLERRVEPWMHLIAVLWPLITAITMIPLGLYNELQIGFGCYVGEYPEGCTDDPNLTCYGQIFGWIFAGAPMLLVLGFLIVSNIAIYCEVRASVETSGRYADGARQQAQKTKQVGSQATLYAMTFFNTVVWQVAIRGIEATELVTRETESDMFWVLVLASLFYPLQGFWNLLLYIKPVYTRNRKRNPSLSRRACFWKALQGEKVSAGTLWPASRISLQLQRQALRHINDGPEAGGLIEEEIGPTCLTANIEYIEDCDEDAPVQSFEVETKGAEHEQQEGCKALQSEPAVANRSFSIRAFNYSFQQRSKSHCAHFRSSGQGPPSRNASCLGRIENEKRLGIAIDKTERPTLLELASSIRIVQP